MKTAIAMMLVAGTASAQLSTTLENPLGTDRGLGDSVTSVDISGTFSNGFEFDPSNEIMTIDFGGPTTIYGLGWDVILTTFDISWLDESTLFFREAGGATQILLTPGAGNANTGSMVPFSSGGILDLSDATGFNIELPSGVLEIEFGEVGFDDVPGGADAVWEAVSTIDMSYTTVPAPAGLAVLGLGALAARRRR